MPITFSAGAVKYKNSSNQYVGINAVSSDDITNTENRLMGTKAGWRYNTQFVQGYVNKNSGYLVHGNGGTYCVTDIDEPIMLNAGDSLTITDISYIFTQIHRVRKDSTGIFAIESTTVNGTDFSCKIGGFYVALVRKPNGQSYSNLTPSDLDGKVIITTSFTGASVNMPRKPNDPYKNLYWNGTQYITSCHAHSATSIDGVIAAGYTAILPVNYRPPKPTYPLKAFFPNVTNVESYLAGPNTEIAVTIGSKSAHICNPGSLFACGTDSSASYNGTFDELINDCRNTRKGFFMGGVIINHPSWSSLTAADMKDAIKTYSDILGIEFYNYGCEVSDSNGWSLTQWDAILSEGIQCFGFAAPDHALETSATANTPYGFIHVIPSCPTDDALLAAIGGGKFYSSLYNDGLKFTNIRLSGTTLTVAASAITESSPTIKFITATRDSTVSGLSSTFTVQDGDVYVRVEVSNGDNKLFSNAIMLN